MTSLSRTAGAPRCDALQARWARVLLGPGGSDTESQTRITDAMVDRRMDGLVMIAPIAPRRELEAIAKTVPMVVIGRHGRSPEYDTVVDDDIMGAGLIVDHLADLGHRRIAHIGHEDRRPGWPATVPSCSPCPPPSSQGVVRPLLLIRASLEKVYGVRTLLVVLLAAAFVLLPSQAGAAPVAKRLAVVTIQNGDTDNERAQLADTTYLRNIFFGGSGSLATWMPAVTHGQLSYVPAGDGVFLAEPNAALRDGDRSRCLSDAARSTAESFLSARGIAWDAVAVVFDIGGCGWGGLGQLPGKVSWYPPKPSLSAIVHEMGHNLGYPHQDKRDCTGGSIAACRSNGYSGNTPMGGGGSGRGYSSVELMYSGWVESSWLVRTSKPGSFTLKPLHSPVSTTGTRVVEYQTSTGTSYVIEARATSSSGVDTAFTSPALRVYSVSNRDYRHAWMVNPGGSVIMDAAHKVTISLRSPATVEIAAIGAVSAKPSPTRPAVASPSPSVAPSPAAPSATPEPSPDDFDDPNSLADSIIPPAASPSRASSSLPLLAAGIVLTAAAVLGALFLALPGRRRRGRHAA